MLKTIDNHRFYDNYKINSKRNNDGTFKYEMNLKHLEKIVAVLNQARHEFKNPCVAHLILRH